MNPSPKRSRSNARPSQTISRTAGSFPVTQVCEIACIILCRIVVPKLARNIDLLA
jgi:hypothetical protein